MPVRPDGSAHFPRPPQYALPLGLGVHGAEGPDAAMLLLRHRHEEPPGTAPPFVPFAPS
ncbi:hypothetical protein OG698_23090 [Streptomyces sp. NBC_01003]|uniref:hypothetical protein n=1 Tax=Streptomyces sp. NBC_01003 TaxID=2903714 RepID=UPI00386BA980|nr:hypothetical protein OG698_23090 [Streptomyces sp. NBC_01003]